MMVQDTAATDGTIRLDASRFKLPILTPVRHEVLLCGCEMSSRVDISEGRYGIQNNSWARVEPKCGRNHSGEMLAAQDWM